MRFKGFLVLIALCAVPVGAHATTVDFDARAAAGLAPITFDGGLDSPLNIGTATFTGGELLLQQTGGVDQTGVYATSNLGGAAYKDPLGIAFSQAISGFSVLLTNNTAGTFTVSDNLGDLSTLVLLANVSQTFTLAGNGITSVSVAQTGRQFDFAIDNVTFSPAGTGGGTVTPEPSSFVLLGTGLLGATGSARRKFLG